MLVLKILGIIVFMFIISCCIIEINERCIKRFKVPLFSKNTMICIFVSSILMLISKIWYNDIIKTGKGDLLNPKVLIGLSVIIALCCLINIYRQTNFVYGSVGIILYVIACIFLYIGIFLFLLVFIFGGIFGTPAQPVRQVK